MNDCLHNYHHTIIEGSSPQFTEISVNLIRNIRYVIVTILIIIILPLPFHPGDGDLTLL